MIILGFYHDLPSIRGDEATRATDVVRSTGCCLYRSYAAGERPRGCQRYSLRRVRVSTYVGEGHAGSTPSPPPAPPPPPLPPPRQAEVYVDMTVAGRVSVGQYDDAQLSIF